MRKPHLLIPALVLVAACGGSAGHHDSGPPPLKLVHGCASAVFSDGNTFCVTRKSDGRVSCGAIGVGPVTVKPVSGIASPTSIGFFQADRCATLADGSVSCWSDGAGTFGATATVDPNLTHAMAAFPVGYTDADMKLGALTSDGELEWEDGSGKVVSADKGIKQFMGLPSINIVLYGDGSLYWRDLEQPQPLLMAGSGAVAFSGDWIGTCYLDRYSSVYCGKPPFQLVLEDATQLSGYCAAKKDGSLWCWSYDLTTNVWSAPVENAGPGTVVSLANGCGVFDGGSVYCWKGTATPTLATTACD